jgi:Sulfotransferase domain
VNERGFQSRLPDFLGVGPPRGATSWLDSVLRGHVGLPRDVKEVDFFVKNYSRGIQWYQRYFSECDSTLPMGEICPSYFGSEEACSRIAEHLPHCRIICTFRDPVEMIYSFYKLARRNAWTKAANFETYVPEGWGQHALRLRKWQTTFGRENVLICLYDDLESDPQGYLDPICDFIGIPRVAIRDSPIATRRVNSFASEPKNPRFARRARKLRDWLSAHEAYGTVRLLTRTGFWRYCFERGKEFEPLRPEVEARLRNRFRPEVEALEELIGRDLGAWKRLRCDGIPTDTAGGS